MCTCPALVVFQGAPHHAHACAPCCRYSCPALLLHCPQDSWSAEEDAKLRQLHAQYGTSWSRISKNLKGRTSQQCRARWHQINNTRSKSCGSGGAGALLAAVASGAGSSGGGRGQSVSFLRHCTKRLMSKGGTCANRLHVPGCLLGGGG